MVTARKRENSRTSISIQAFTTEQLRERGISNFEDCANFLPSVSYGTTASTPATIVPRAVAVQFSAQTAPATLYLDEQPVTADAQNPDIRAVDIERIEALSGPQPTTFGAGSQSGALRI
ncbi:MAG: Plug domain-containing protein [Parvularculaceae bacterium]